MIPYLVLLSLVVIFASFTFDSNFEDKGRIAENFIKLFLILFAGLAASRGDAVQYAEAYKDGFGLTFEPAINIIGNLYGFLGFNIYILFLTFAAIGVLFKFSFFKNASGNLLFVTLVSYVSAFYISCEMGAIRFGAGIGFILYNVFNIENKRFKSFIFIALIGSLFHASVLLTIPLYYLRWKVTLRNALVSLFFISIFIGLIDFEAFFDFLFETYFPNAIILVKYSTYFHEPAFITPVLIKRVLFFFVLCFFFKELEQKQKWFRTMFLMYSLSIIVFFMFRANHTAASRLSFLFSSVEPVLFSSFLLLTNNKKIKLFIATFIFLYAYVNIATSLKSQTDEQNLYLPYKLFFQR